MNTAKEHSDADFYRMLLDEYRPRPLKDGLEFENATKLVATLPATKGKAYLDLRTLYLLLIREYRERVEEPKLVMTLLRELIERRGLQQKEIAELAGIPPTNLSAVLNGKRKLGRREAKKLADYFSVPVATFGSTYAVAADL